VFSANQKRKILQQRFVYEKSLSEVARMFRTSRIKVRQLEVEYLNKTGKIKEIKNG
jgi:DNA-directed RNA polymerase sigma subunit (sigma70/sigma32)